MSEPSANHAPQQPAAPAPQYATPPQYAAPAPQYAAPPAQNLSPKSWLAALLLSIFLGELGIDRFYLGKIGTGILKLITFGGFGIWWIIDIILLIAGAATDKQGLVVKYQG
jgi:TM2 domain-containing membrane protein YozV